MPYPLAKLFGQTLLDLFRNLGKSDKIWAKEKSCNSKNIRTPKGMKTQKEILLHHRRKFYCITEGNFIASLNFNFFKLKSNVCLSYFQRRQLNDQFHSCKLLHSDQQTKSEYHLGSDHH